jgi:hypothetical protein
MSWLAGCLKRKRTPRRKRFALAVKGNRAEVRDIAEVRTLVVSIQTDRRTLMRTMQRALLATVVGLTFATPGMTSAQAQDMKQTLGGLLTGNQDRDNAVQQAYERGYQRGRADEARQSRRGPSDGGYYQERGGYSNSR